MYEHCTCTLVLENYVDFSIVLEYTDASAWINTWTFLDNLVTAIDDVLPLGRQARLQVYVFGRATAKLLSTMSNYDVSKVRLLLARTQLDTTGTAASFVFTALNDVRDDLRANLNRDRGVGNAVILLTVGESELLFARAARTILQSLMDHRVHCIIVGKYTV